MQKNFPNGIKKESSDNHTLTVFEDIRQGLQQAIKYEKKKHEKQLPKEVENGLLNR